MALNKLTLGVLVVFAGIAVLTCYAQKGQWAAADDTTATFMIDAERQWAEAACTHNKIAEKILADDFQGTAPDGRRYSKSVEVAVASDMSETAQDCRLLDAKVHFFGNILAVVYGSESSVEKAKDGPTNPDA